MKRIDAPKKQPVPFGINGQREALLPVTPAGNNTASYDVGFPPVTMILKAAGGLPPRGQDMNQILFELAATARWTSAGAGYAYDEEFSAAVAGYPVGAKVLSTDGAGYWLNTSESNSANPEVTNGVLTGWVPSGFYGVSTITGLAASGVTLTPIQAARDRIELSGSLTANINIIVPAWIKKWTIVNNTTGSFSVTVKTQSGTGVAIASGKQSDVYGDGANVVTQGFLISSNNLSEIAAAGAAAQVEAQTNLGLGAGSLLPVGSPIPWPVATPPAGWLACNGGTFSLTANPKLAIAYPSGTLPDLRGEFIRGWDNSRGVDSGRALLSAQGDAIRNIVGGNIRTVISSNTSTAPTGAFNAISRTGTAGSGTVDLMNIDFSADRVVPTAAENRPRNIAFNYIVRAA